MATEILNDAKFYQFHEIIGGKKFMAPAPNPTHGGVIMRLGMIIGSSIIDWRRGINGVPDMVVEVLSKSTKKKDVTIKKDLYEAQGVREYWIVDPWARSVAVYLLRDGKYFLDEDYILFDEEDLNYMTEEEKSEVKHEVPVATLDGLKIPLKYIFKWGYK